MSRYLDPKTDVVFKKIFGEHPHLLKSFLNAVLPLPENGLIESLEYLSPQQVPLIPEFKYTIVDVKCKDQQGRVFIVEMQVQWINSFMQRLLFGTSTAYVKQLKNGEKYDLLKPVYGLALLGCTFDSSSDWYHHYTLVNIEKTHQAIKDLQLIFIELPKFKAATVTEKKLQILWLRFMAEFDERTKIAPEDLLSIPEIEEAIKLSEEAGYTSDELYSYEKYWDAVRTEKTLMEGSYDKGRNEGRNEGREEERLKIVKKLLDSGLPLKEIAQLLEIPLSELEQIF